MSLPAREISVGVGAPTITYNAGTGYNFTPPFQLFPMLLGAGAGWALGNYVFRGKSTKHETLSRIGLTAAGAYGLNFVVANAQGA